jgi:hypothetical protein
VIILGIKVVVILKMLSLTVLIMMIMIVNSKKIKGTELIVGQLRKNKKTDLL